MLDGFQRNLGSISSEIQSLQQQSVSMNIKLKNRQAVRGELSQFIDEMLVPEPMIRYLATILKPGSRPGQKADHSCFLSSMIMDGQVTERAFLKYLHELNHKINFLYEKPPNDIKCFNDIHDILYKLKIKVS